MTMNGSIDVAHSRTTDPETSHAAAASQDPDKMSRLRRKVFNVLSESGPMTDTELLGFFVGAYSPSGIRTRRKELVTLGLVEDSGQRQTLRSGRLSIVWQRSV